MFRRRSRRRPRPLAVGRGRLLRALAAAAVRGTPHGGGSGGSKSTPTQGCGGGKARLASQSAWSRKSRIRGSFEYRRQLPARRTSTRMKQRVVSCAVAFRVHVAAGFEPAPYRLDVPVTDGPLDVVKGHAP